MWCWWRINTWNKVCKHSFTCRVSRGNRCNTNSPAPDETIRYVKESIDIPVVVTIVSELTDVQSKIDAGADILNVSVGANTANIVRKIREKFPLIPIIATGGPTEESILETIEAGANAITYTPPTNSQLFKNKMKEYREIEDKKYKKEF